MNKERIAKVTSDMANECKRPELTGKEIVIYENDRKHCYNRHYGDFSNPKEFAFIMKNLDYIINECDFVLYNEKNNSLEYYKKIHNNITVRVKVENSNELKIKTVFPIPDKKYENKKTKAAYNKYVIN